MFIVGEHMRGSMDRRVNDNEVRDTSMLRIHDQDGTPESFVAISGKAATSQKAASTASAVTHKRKAAHRGLGPYERGVSPMTGEHDYTDIQRMFLRGCEDFKQKTDRKFLTVLEVLWVAEQLGWQRGDVEGEGTWPHQRAGAEAAA